MNEITIETAHVHKTQYAAIFFHFHVLATKTLIFILSYSLLNWFGQHAYNEYFNERNRTADYRKTTIYSLFCFCDETEKYVQTSRRHT